MWERGCRFDLKDEVMKWEKRGNGGERGIRRGQNVSIQCIKKIRYFALRYNK